MAQFLDYLLVLLFVLPLLYFIFKKFKTSKNIPPFPPGPTPWPLIGNIPHMINKRTHQDLYDLSKIHGPLMMLKLGTQNMVIASSSAAAKEILTTQDRILSARHIPSSFSDPEVLNNSAIAWTETCNQRWNYLRTLCRAELFSAKSLDAQTRLREKKIYEMIEYVKGKSEAKEAVNIGELVFITAVNILSNVFMSCDLIFGFDEENNGRFTELYRKRYEKASAANISDFYPILARFDLQGIKKGFKDREHDIFAIMDPIIQARKKSTKDHINQNDFLDVLLQNNFTDLQIFILLIELVLAGTDTSVISVTWVMAELMNNPESMKKVIEELDREVGIDRVNESHIVKLCYLHACIKETLRIHPPAPFLLPRRAPATCQVMNYTIPKNAHVYINVWAIGRDPLIWEEPLMFKPERFLKSAFDFNFKGNDYEFIPFGGGRRICAGMPMAARQVPLVIAALIQSFDWSLSNGKGSHHELDMTEKFGFALDKEQPLLLFPKSRN